MPFPRKRSPVQFSEQERLKLESMRKSRTEEKRRTLRSGRSTWRVAPPRQAAATTGRCDCLGTTLCLPEAKGTGLFLRIVDVQVAGRSPTPALRRSRASGAAQTEPLQTPQDPAAG